MTKNEFVNRVREEGLKPEENRFNFIEFDCGYCGYVIHARDLIFVSKNPYLSWKAYTNKCYVCDQNNPPIKIKFLKV